MGKAITGSGAIFYWCKVGNHYNVASKLHRKGQQRR